MYSILTECPLFRGLTEDQIHEVIDGRGDYTLADYRDGELIARRDTAYSGLMIIVRGKVHGEMPAASGRPVTIEPLEAPQLIAPAFLFGGYNKLPIDVVADGDATIMTLHRGYLFELMQSNVLIMSNFIDIISNRANVWSKKIYFLSFRSLKEKAAGYLLGHSTEASPSVEMPDHPRDSAVFRRDAQRRADRARRIGEKASGRPFRRPDHGTEPQGARGYSEITLCDCFTIWAFC